MPENERLRDLCLARSSGLEAGGLSPKFPSRTDMTYLTARGEGSYEDISKVYVDRPRLRQEYEAFRREMLDG